VYIKSDKPEAAEAPQNKLEDVDDALEFAENLIGQRVLARVGRELRTEMHNAGVLEFHVAGGACLRSEPDDLDLYPAEQTAQEFQALAKRFMPSAKGKNQYGQTELDGVKVQFCCTKPAAITELVSTFDFAHCMVGVTLRREERRADSVWRVDEVYLAPQFLAAMLVQGTFYTEGIWPLRSLTRIPKVARKLGLNQAEIYELSIQVVGHVVRQGLDKVLEEDARFAERVGVKRIKREKAREAKGQGCPTDFEDLFGPAKFSADDDRDDYPY
jgi:hypothetical protein